MGDAPNCISDLWAGQAQYELKSIFIFAMIRLRRGSPRPGASVARDGVGHTGWLTRNLRAW